MISQKSLPTPESLLESSADGFALLDMECVPVYVNPAALRLMGLICPEPGDFLDSISPADRDNVKAACVSALAAEGHSFHVDFRAARRRPDPLDAADRPAPAKAAARVEAHVKLHRDPGGASWILLNLREMREAPRKARIGKMVPASPLSEPGTAPLILPGHSCAKPTESAEQLAAELASELASKSRLLDMLLDNLPVMACRLDGNGVFLESRGAALRRIGQEDNEAVGRNLSLEWPECRSLLEKVLAGEPAHFEYEYGQGVRKRVHEMWFMPNPADGGAIGFGVDITERKRAEDELSRSEAFNRRVVESSRDGIMVLDPEGKLLSISQGGRKLMEMVEPEIFLDRSWLDFWRGDDRASAENALRVASAGGVGKFQGYCPSLTGKPKWWDVLLTPILNPASDRECLIAICRDITESKRFEESLRRSKEQLEAILRAISDAVVVADAGGRVVYANDAAARMLGMPSSQEILDVALEDLALSLAARDERGLPVAWPSPPRPEDAGTGNVLRLPPRNGEAERWVVANTVSVKDAEGRVGLVIASAYDFTERKRAEEALHRSEDQLRQSQKMEAVGRLAGGVAHDFNNLLTAINGYSELLMKSMRDSDPLRGTVGEISRAGDRAASLTRQLLTLSRRQVLAKRILDVNQVVSEIRQMLGRLIGEDIKLTTAADPALPTVMADPGQMEQLILNLALNARDAMPTGGALTIETSLAHMNKGDSGTVFAIEPGDYVRLTVSDTGIGMDEDVKAHLFEPFFTTKPPGKGTGLGLSTVYGILKTAGGNISVSSEPSKGTRISVYLPAGDPPSAKDVAEAAVRQSANAAKAAASRESRETILLVEDEDMVRRLIGQVLLSNGYNLLEAGSGAAALEVVERNPGVIDLLLTDVVMAGMSGRELSERLVLIRPGIKVLYMSGYTDDAVLRHGVQQSSTAFLCKPFSPGVLIRKLREVIDGVPSVSDMHAAMASR